MAMTESKQALVDAGIAAGTSVATLAVAETILQQVTTSMPLTPGRLFAEIGTVVTVTTTAWLGSKFANRANRMRPPQSQ